MHNFFSEISNHGPISISGWICTLSVLTCIQHEGVVVKHVVFGATKNDHFVLVKRCGRVRTHLSGRGTDNVIDFLPLHRSCTSLVSDSSLWSGSRNTCCSCATYECLSGTCLKNKRIWCRCCCSRRKYTICGPAAPPSVLHVLAVRGLK